MWSSTGVTDYHFNQDHDEFRDSEYVDISYIVSARLNHDEIMSISRLKYRFINKKEAEDYYYKLRELFPTSFVRLSKNTSQTIIENC